MRRFGVEEELLLVNGETGYPMAVSQQIIEAREGQEPELTNEMQQEMIEAVTKPQTTIAELRDAISAGRTFVDDAAQEFGARVAALATSPLPVHPHPTEKERYQTMVERYGATARHSMECGFHIHASIDSPEEGVGAIDRMRNWLPALIALSANSPFKDGEDTDYASYRTVSWRKWPTAGPTELFGSHAAYETLEKTLLDTGVIVDSGMLYFDARLSRNHPTVEIRVADVCLSQQAAVTIAALARALVDTAAREWKEGVEPRAGLAMPLRLASWRAAISGLSGDLVHPESFEPAPAAEVVGLLVSHVSRSLAEFGDTDDVAAGINAILGDGNGAQWQRKVYDETGSLEEVVRRAAAETLVV
jgi:carboxylate-amine ligase